MVPYATSSLTCRYLTRPVEASAHCIRRAGCGKAAVEPCQPALHPPPPIRYDASLCTTTRCSAQMPVPDRIHWLFSDPVGPGVCTILQTDFGELPSVLKNSLGARFRPRSSTKHTGFGAFCALFLLVISSTPTLSTSCTLPRTPVNKGKKKCRGVAARPYGLLGGTSSPQMDGGGPFRPRSATP